MFTSIEDLRKWFTSQGRGGKPAPYWSLYIMNYGEKNNRVAANTRIDDLEESFGLLVSNMKGMNYPAGNVKFRIDITDNTNGTNPVAVCYMQFSEIQNAVAGINGIGLPDGYISKSELDFRMKLFKLEQENDRLKDQLEAPSNSFIGSLQTLLDAPSLKPLIAAVAAKVMNVPISAAAINGIETTVERPVNSSPNDFDANLDKLEELTGMPAEVIIKKVLSYATIDSESVKKFLQSI
jgi:hypothetical protein